MPTVTRCTRCGAETIGSAGPCVTCETAPADPVPVDAPPADPLLARLRRATRGEYEVLRELGRGPATAVFLARDLGLDLEVAIKVLLPEQTRRRGMGRRFLEAAARAAALGAHPNVLRVYRAPERYGLRYLVMQRVDGAPLARQLRLTPRLPWDTVCRVLAQAARALEHAHAHGVAHGDVSPSSVMLDRDGTVVVTDFGIAGIADARARAGSEYASPERRGGAPPTPASDQWSLGAVAYEMLAGVPPAGASPARLRTLRPDCPEALEALVHRMLAPSPDARWPELGAVRAALAEVDRDDGPVPAVERVEAVVTAARPRRGAGAWRAALKGAIAAVVVAAAALATARWPTVPRPSPARPEPAPVPVSVAPALDTAPPRPARVVIVGGARGRPLQPGDSVLLRARVLDGRRRPVRDARVTWASSDTGRVVVRAGRLGAYAVARAGAGPATVTARVDGARGSVRLAVDTPRLVRAQRAGEVVAAAEPVPSAAARDEAAAVAAAAARVAARREIERFVANLEGRRLDALARQLGADGDPGRVRAFLAWLRGASRLEVSPVVILPAAAAAPGRAVSEFGVWLHWRTRSFGVARRRGEEARFRLLLTEDNGAWRPVEVQLAGRFPPR